MKSRQLMFFTVLEDIKSILQDIETLIDVQYYKTGLTSSVSIPTYSSIFNTPNVGITLSGDWNRIDNYLVMKKETLLNIRDVQQKNGDIKFAVDQLNNLKSIEIKIGGIFREKEKVIIAGRVSTISEDEVSNELYKLFTSKIKKKFRKIGMFYVGKIEEEKLGQGWRLVTNEGSPRDYDLAFN